MSWRAVVVVVVLLAGTANAGELAQTQQVIGKHAAAAKRDRIVGGAVATGTGLAIGVAGGYLLATVDDDAFLGDLSKSVGYTLLTTGGILAIAGPFLMLRRSELEEMRDELTVEEDARHVRTVVAHRARGARRTRRIMRGVGALLAGVGATSTLVGVIGGEAIDGDVRNDLIGAGAGVGCLGVGLTLLSFTPSQWDIIERDLGRTPVPTTAAIVPARGGFVAGVGGSF